MTSTQAKELRDFPGFGPLTNDPVEDRYARPNAKAMPVPEAVVDYDKEINDKIVPLGGMLPISQASQ